MSWRPIGPVIASERAYAGFQVDDLWIFRTALDVFACQPGETAPVWEAKLSPNQDLIGPKLLARSVRLAFTVEDFGSQNLTLVVALNAQTGKEVWRQPVDGVASQFGLAAIDNRVWLLVRSKDLSNRLVQIESYEGKILAELPSPETNGIVTVGDNLLIPAVDGLHILQNNQGDTKKLTPRQPRQIVTDGKLIYWYESTDAPSGPLHFACYDLGQQKEWGKEVIALNDEAKVKKLEPMQTRGQVAVLYDAGFLILDFERGAVQANVVFPEGTRGLGLVATPVGLVLACSNKPGRSKVILYSRAHKPVEELPVEALRPSFLAYSNGILAVNGAEGVRFFEWDEEEESNHQVAKEDEERALKQEKPVEAAFLSKTADPFALALKSLEAGPRREKLQALIDEFLACMQANPGSDQQRERGQRFNRLFDEFVQDFPEEDITKFAVRVSLMGIPYEDAYRDVIYVRGLGKGN